MSMMPIKYNDPLYAALAARMEGAYGLPGGILNAIRTMGERSNADQVSEAGARSPYQFIPKTRQGMIKNYGVDPWADAESATKAAALLLKENYGRAGNWNDAVGMYHGGLSRRNWGPRTRSYQNRVGNFEEQNGGTEMPLGQSRYPVPYYGADPLAPEAPKQAVPIPGDPGISSNVTASSPVASKKRGGILGALESVFMPDPDSRWAAALRGGIWDAKANQAAYKAGVAKQQTDQAMSEAKLKNFLTKGEYQIAGNNVIHFPPDGGEPEIIAPPATKSEKERLIDRWSAMDDADPAKQLIERMLEGANADDVLQSKERQASTRAGATVQSARIRSAPKPNSGLPPLPPGFKVVK